MIPAREVTHRLYYESEGNTMRSGDLLGEMEDADHFISIISFELFSWYLLCGNVNYVVASEHNLRTSA